jgi:chromosome segregation ATPase
MAKELAVLKRALSLDSPGILEIVQENERLRLQLSDHRQQEETATDGPPDSRSELLDRVWRLEREKSRLAWTLEEKHRELEKERTDCAALDKGRKKYLQEMETLREELQRVREELEIVKDERNRNKEDFSRMQRSLSVSALNESVMEEHVEKLKEQTQDQDVLVHKLKKEILRLHEEIRNRDNKHREVMDLVILHEQKLKESRKANKERERDILRLERNLDQMQSLLSKQTVRQLQRLTD